MGIAIRTRYFRYLPLLIYWDGTDGKAFSFIKHHMAGGSQDIQNGSPSRVLEP